MGSRAFCHAQDEQIVMENDAPKAHVNSSYIYNPARSELHRDYPWGSREFITSWRAEG